MAELEQDQADLPEITTLTAEIVGDYVGSNKSNLKGCFSRRKGVALGATEQGSD